MGPIWWKVHSVLVKRLHEESNSGICSACCTFPKLAFRLSTEE